MHSKFIDLPPTGHLQYVQTPDHYVQNQLSINYQYILCSYSCILIFIHIHTYPFPENNYTGASKDEANQCYYTFQPQDNSESFT